MCQELIEMIKMKHVSFKLDEKPGTLSEHNQQDKETMNEKQENSIEDKDIDDKKLNDYIGSNSDKKKRVMRVSKGLPFEKETDKKKKRKGEKVR